MSKILNHVLNSILLIVWIVGTNISLGRVYLLKRLSLGILVISCIFFTVKMLTVVYSSLLIKDFTTAIITGLIGLSLSLFVSPLTARLFNLTYRVIMELRGEEDIQE